MRNILVIGSGKSTSFLLKYLLDKSHSEKLFITVADINTENAEKIINNHENAKTIILDVFNDESRKKAIKESDIVVSMLPARFHLEVAKDCILYRKNMVTASYVSKEMEELNEEVKANGLVFMNEV